jgi:hypothetical protein
MLYLPKEAAPMPEQLLLRGGVRLPFPLGVVVGHHHQQSCARLVLLGIRDQDAIEDADDSPCFFF